MKKKRLILMIAALLVLGLSACTRTDTSSATPDPHEGQVQVYDGYGYVWMTPLEGVERNNLTVNDFQMQGDTPVYVSNRHEVRKGIDVSEFQHDIDWTEVKHSGIEFAIIRCGYRGYTEGGLYEDKYFRANMKGAAEAGIDIGVYFTTQAITVAEAKEEAEYVLSLISGYEVTYPVCLDWEKNYTDEARAENLDQETLTNCAVAFCGTIQTAGYDAAMYYNRTIGYYRYDLSRLTDYLVWFSLPVTPPDVTYPSFLYKIDFWQYSISGTVPGISTEVDLDYRFIDKPDV